MTEYERKPASTQPVVLPRLPAPQPFPAAQRPSRPLQRRTDPAAVPNTALNTAPETGSTAGQLQANLNAHTLRPALQRQQQAAPVLSALALQREASADLLTQQASLQRQIAGVQAGLPANAVQTALQRQAGPAPLNRAPASPAEWTQTAQLEVQRVQDPRTPAQTRSLSTADMGAHRRTLQAVTGGLSGGFKADRRPADERYADYGAQLATLQRQPLTRLIPRVFMTQIPAGERPSVQRAVDAALQRLAVQDAQDAAALNLQGLQRQLAGVQAQSQQPVMERILARRGGGSPLPQAVRRHLETGLNHNLETVRIHDDAEADKLAKSVQATAFTAGTDIFFQSGKFDPNTQTGLELLAHEVTHTVQQSKGQVGKGIDPDAGLEQQARDSGKKLSHLAATPTLVPPAHVGGPHAPGVYTPQAALGRVQQATVNQMALKPLYDLQPGGYQRATDLSLQRWGLGDAWNATGGKVVSAVKDGAEALAAKGKELITSGLSAIPGYRELCMAFGKDLVTGQSVGGQGEGILDTLANWVPGPLKDIMRALKETNVIGKAWAWFQGELGKLNLGGALGEIASAIKSADLGKAKAAVTTRISAVKRLILGSANKIAEIALTVITAGLGPVGQRIMAGLRGAGQNIVKILKDPVAFAKNLINAVKGGFSQFASNAPSNLGKVLGGWLGGSTNISFQGGFNLPGLLMTALSVVGLTYQAMRGRLVKALGPGGSEKVGKAETTVAALQTMKSGLHKADEMKGEQGSVGNEIKTGITQEVTQSVVIAGIKKLVVMLVPGGGFINAIIGAFQTVQTIVQQAATIGSVITNALSSVAAIAAGNISSAVGSIERALVGSLSVALTWLTKVLGLGGLGTKIRGIIAKVKGKLDGVLNKIVAKMKTVIEKLMGKGKEKPGDPTGKSTSETDKTKDHDEKVKKGLADIPRIEKSFARGSKLENQDAAKNVARAVKGRHPIFKAVTPKFSKDKVTYDWVASSGSQPGTTGLAVLNINVEGIRKEFWSQGRPGWSRGTKKTLATAYPQHHVTLPVVGVTVKLKSGFDRRHIEAFDQTVTQLASQLNHMTFDDASALLSGKGFAPGSKSEAAIKAALKKFLTAEFNKVENLFVDEAAENQEKGRQMEQAENRRTRAQQAGDQAAVDRETSRLASEATDVPKGTATGKALTGAQRAVIGRVRLTASRIRMFEPLRGHVQAAKNRTASQALIDLWDTANLTIDQLKQDCSAIAEFSKSGSVTSNNTIRQAIEQATSALRTLSDIVGG